MLKPRGWSPYSGTVVSGGCWPVFYCDFWLCVTITRSLFADGQREREKKKKQHLILAIKLNTLSSLFDFVLSFQAHGHIWGRFRGLTLWTRCALGMLLRVSAETSVLWHHSQPCCELSAVWLRSFHLTVPVSTVLAPPQLQSAQPASADCLTPLQGWNQKSQLGNLSTFFLLRKPAQFVIIYYSTPVTRSLRHLNDDINIPGCFLPWGGLMFLWPRVSVAHWKGSFALNLD